MQRTKKDTEIHEKSSFLHCRCEVQDQVQNPHASLFEVNDVGEQRNEIVDNLDEHQVDQVVQA